MTDLLSVKEAQQRLLEYFSPLPVEKISLWEAAGRVLAEPVAAAVNLPPFANSSMDGFAVRAADLASASQDQPVQLQVVADIPAGQVVEVHLDSGQAARIMTGAPLPDGADTVIPVEDTDFNTREPGVAAPDQVLIYRAGAPGDNVRPAGQDVRVGEPVLQPGRRLRPQDIGFLSMLGVPQVSVHRLPRTAFFSSGDELLPADQPLLPGKIHDANSYVLSALLREAGSVPVGLGIVPDQADAVQNCLDRASDEGVDLIVSSAGVSVGAFDFVRSVVEQQGRLDFWRVNMRPGKPLAFGHYRGIPFIGLPGNPVSAFVGFEVFVRPALNKLSGVSHWQRQTFRVRLAEPVESDGRESYLRAWLSEENQHIVAHLTGHQGSGNLRSLVQANALLVIPSGVKSLPAGAEVDGWLLGELYHHETEFTQEAAGDANYGESSASI